MSNHGAHAAVIADVEEALRRLLDPATPSADKQSLEDQLAQFKANASSCLPVLFELLTASSNEYALWFACTTLEEYVATKWSQFPREQRLHVRQAVWEIVVSARQVAFVLRKLRKVVADIARLEWSAADGQAEPAWPEFLSQVEALVVEPSMCERGLELMCCVAEEFGRDDAQTLVFAATKRQARAQLTTQLPTLLALLSSVLQRCSTAMQSANAQSAEHDRVAQIALQTLTHLVAWAPVAEHMTDAWVVLLFELALQGPRQSVASVAALQCLTELMTKRFLPAAIDQIVAQVLYCLCPLLRAIVSDNAVASTSEEFLDRLSEFVEVFLTQHLKRLEHPQFESMLPEFLQLVQALTAQQPHVDGFLNCLSVWEVFVSYMEEAEQNEEATNERARAALAAYEHGLVGVMLHLLERVNYATNQDQLEELADDDDPTFGSSSENRNDDNGADAAQAFDLEGGDKSSMGAQGTGSLQDLAQWNSDRGTDAAAGGGARVELSDRKQFIVDCIALIRRIAAFPACAPPLIERMAPKVVGACDKVVFRLHETPAYPPNSNEWEQERATIRDLTTNCAILSSVAAQYYSSSQDIGDRMAGWQILHSFIQLSEYMVQHRLHTRGDDLVQLQCEALTCVRFCLGCVPFVLQSGARQDVLNATESILQVLLRTLDTMIVPSPQIVMQNALQLLANLGFVLSYEDMQSVPSMTQLERNIHRFSMHLPLAIQGDLYTAMSNSILNSAISMRGNEASEQRWAEAYGGLILPIREAITQSAMTLQQNEHRVLESVMVTQIQRDCYLVRCLARSVETKPKMAKDAFFSAYEETFPALLSLLTTYFTTIKKTAQQSQATSQVKSALKVVNEVVRLYAQLLKSIRKEMQKDKVAEIMRTFVEIFSDAQLSAVLNAHGNAGLMVLCGFLQLLKIVVEEPTSVFASFLQNILDLCFGPLKELIFSHPESDSVILSYYVALAEQLLEKHYRFFVVSSMSMEGQRERVYSSDVAHAYFLSVFESLASILSRQGSNLNPRLCGQVLGLLDRVDKAQNLFSFAGFQSELRMGFLATLLGVLTKGEMNLLQDEVIQLLYRVASVDFASFYQVFLEQFTKQALSQAELERAAQQSGQYLQWSGQTDFPTFAQEVVAFLNDLRVLRAQT